MIVRNSLIFSAIYFNVHTYANTDCAWIVLENWLRHYTSHMYCFKLQLLRVREFTYTHIAEYSYEVGEVA